MPLSSVYLSRARVWSLGQSIRTCSRQKLLDRGAGARSIGTTIKGQTSSHHPGRHRPPFNYCCYYGVLRSIVRHLGPWVLKFQALWVSILDSIRRRRSESFQKRLTVQAVLAVARYTPYAHDEYRSVPLREPSTVTKQNVKRLRSDHWTYSIAPAAQITEHYGALHIY